MSFLNIFKSANKIKREEVSDINKVAVLVQWFVKNDKFVKVIVNPSSSQIYREGFRPKAGNLNNPEQSGRIDEFSEWFVRKIFIDLNLSKDFDKEAFKDFIDALDKGSSESIIALGEYFMKYDIDADNFVYERDLNKIPESERDWFKVLLLDDNTLSSEIRILAWVYHEFFGEWYKIKP